MFKRENAVRLVVVFAAVAALLVGASAAADAATHDPIVGGTPAAPGEYPAQGFLDIDNGAGFCGGSLVGSRWFLTAAHCAAGMTPSRLHVGLGNTNIDKITDVYSVVSIVVNAAYNHETQRNDTAMLKLNRPAPYQPLRVIRADESELWAPGVTARIVGWGNTAPGGDISVDLLEADAPMRSDGACEDPLSYGTAFDRNTMVCAGDGTTDTCQGDSGGPLMVPDGLGFVLVGLTSWGFGCADPLYPGVYTRLGAPGINAWVMTHYPRASFTSAPDAPTTSAAVTFTSTSFHPEAAGFTVFKWDFDDDGLFDDATGAKATTTFATAGRFHVALEASKPAGDRAVAGGDVVVTAGSPPPPPPPPPPPAPVRCVVPRLAGKTLVTARTALTRAHCRLGVVTKAYSSGVRSGRIIRNRPTAGTKLVRNARINVVLSRGPQKRR